MDKMLQKWVMPIIASALLLCFWLRSQNPYQFPESHKIQFETLIVQPDGITCGPTSTTMLLNRYGKDVKLDDVKSKTKTEWFHYGRKPIGMTAPEFIESCLNSFGVPAKLKRSSIEELKYFVSTNRPIIVLVRSGQTTWHYIVVVGYTKDVILVADPGSGKVESMKLKNFIGSWEFTTDMSGNDVGVKCGFCKGTGKITGVNAGPLTSCPLCDGKGKNPDVMVSLLNSADVYPKTMIVPKKSLTPASK